MAILQNDNLNLGPAWQLGHFSTTGVKTIQIYIQGCEDCFEYENMYTGATQPSLSGIDNFMR